jgi:membrane-associated phospholipid phosphatase
VDFLKRKFNIKEVVYMVKIIGKNKWNIYFGAIIILLAIFTIKDLPISKAVYNKDSLWGNFFYVFGQHPAFILGFIGASILFRVRNTKNIVKNLIVGFLSIVFAVFNGFYNLFVADSRLFRHENLEGSMKIYAWVFAIILTVVAQVVLFKIPKEQVLKYKRAALITVLLVFTEIVLVNIFKVYWGRVRFRDMLDDFSKFTPWYLLQGDTGNTSFPSGHTADAWTIIVLTLFVSKEKIKLYRSALIAAIVFGALVSISRVVVGAHFASDVTVGAAITIGIFLLLKSIINDANIINNRII